MRDAMRRTTSPRPPRGFTLTELLVVIAIIGILVTFILIAAQDGIRRAEEKATQSLIAKLDMGIAERIEAILLRRADASLGHHALAAVVNSNFGATSDTIAAAINGYFGVTTYTNSIVSPQRAQVIAQFDLVRAELPDVFFSQAGTTYGDVKTSPPKPGMYPINFAGLDFPSGSGNYLIPLGAASSSAPGAPNFSTAAPGDPNLAIGIFGATWQAAAGIYKNLGYLPQGYDGADNNSDGFVDDFLEGTGGDTTRATQIQNNLTAHKHNTARSEMLYALLVEGVGPMGSTFSRDEFSDRQVKDTDGDGLPEFIDAWGQPLQFFRWPIFYNNLSSTSLTPGAVGYVAKGTDLYSGPSEPRQIDPLDPNQTLVALAWWSSSPNSSTAIASETTGAAGALSQSYREQLFEMYFHSLTDPNYSSSATVGTLWDRGGFYARRAYYSRFLILSGGPDQTPGVAVPQAFPSTASTIALGVNYLVGGSTTFPVGENAAGVAATNLPASGDDITNQGLAAPGGGVR